MSSPTHRSKARNRFSSTFNLRLQEYKCYLVLRKFIVRGMVSKVKRILKGLKDPNFKALKHPTPLHSAVRCQNLDMVTVLIEHGVDVNWSPAGVGPVLHLAISENNVNLVHLLLQNKANPNRFFRNQSPLMLAIMHNHGETLNDLIAFGANVNLANSQGDTPLHQACRHGNLPLARRLLELGAEVNVHGHKKRTCLHLATVMKNLDLVQLLVEQGAEIGARDMTGWDVITIAATSGPLDILEYILSRAPEGCVNQPNKDGKTPLLETISRPHSDEVVNLLIRHGADPLFQDQFGNNCLFGNIRSSGSTEMTRELISRGLDVNCQVTAFNGATPLHAACVQGHVEQVKILLRAGANPNIADRNNYTPLFLAIIKCHYRVVGELLMHRSLYRPLHMTDTVLDFVVKDVFSPLLFSLMSRDCAMISVLLAFGAGHGDHCFNNLSLSQPGCWEPDIVCPVRSYVKKLELLGLEVPEIYLGHVDVEGEDEDVFCWKQELESLDKVKICSNPKTTLLDFLRMDLEESLRFRKNAVINKLFSADAREYCGNYPAFKSFLLYRYRTMVETSSIFERALKSLGQNLPVQLPESYLSNILGYLDPSDWEKIGVKEVVD